MRVRVAAARGSTAGGWRRAAAKLLCEAVANIHAGTTQKEILRALLDGGSTHCAAYCAIRGQRQGTATGWQGRGFADDDAVKDFSLDMNADPVLHAYQNRVAAPANIAEMDSRFVEHFGGPANEQVLVLPLVLKDKVAALLYADGGRNGVLDAPSLELLVMATSAWLEVVSLRKQAQREIVDARRASAPCDSSRRSRNFVSDPFARISIAGQLLSTLPRRIPETEPEPVRRGGRSYSSWLMRTAAGAAAPAAAADPFAELSPEDADTHRKAQRFARLLVDEIKLYNQAKVAEGTQAQRSLRPDERRH